MGYAWSNVNGTSTADDNRFVTTEDMAVKDYTLQLSTMPGGATGGARHVTIIRTVTNATPDTVTGGITVTGTNPAGETITELFAVGANGVTVTGTKWFKTVTKVHGNTGWVKGGADPDTIIVGCTVADIVAEGYGTLHGVQINTTAASTIVVADARGTIATLPASVAVGTFYEWDVDFAGYISITLNGASDITVLHSSSMPSTYAMS
jgi:hypothetical protein